MLRDQERDAIIVGYSKETLHPYKKQYLSFRFLIFNG